MPTKFKWNERIIKKQIRSEAEIPEKVTEKVEEVYKMIKGGKIEQVNPTNKKSPFLCWSVKFASGLVIILLASVIICATNPVLAKNIPIIGEIFAQLQDKVSFFGNFTEKATVLKEPEVESPDFSNSAYTKNDGGLTITFSEVYANEQVIYLTMQVKSEEPFPDPMINELNGRQDPGFFLEIMKKYSFIEYGAEDTDENSDSSIYAYMAPEGTLEDDSTYNCIVRLNLKDDVKDYTDIENIEVPHEFMLSISLDKLIGWKAKSEYWDSGYTPEELSNMSEEEWRNVMSQMPEEYHQLPNKFENFWYEGKWDFDIPVTIDSSQTVTMDINEINEEGIGLESVVKTPYELDVNVKCEEGSNSNIFIVALDANGNRLPYIGSAASGSSVDNFAIQDRDISTIDIYILDENQYFDELKGEERYNNNENKPFEEKWSTLLDENARYHKTIHF